MFPPLPKKKKRQTRRSISLKGLTYQRLKKYCDAEGFTISGFLEDVIAAQMDIAGQPHETVLKVHYPKKRETDAASGVFTF